ncbi:MAG: hypothetical protein ABTQ34_04435 [Bdellovibrionales bacterium]
MRDVRLLILSLLLLSGCAPAYRPLVDMRGVDPVDFKQDLAECRAYAAQRIPYNSHALPLESEDDAAYDPNYGSISPTKGTIKREKRIIRRCLMGRGYRVLD